MSTSGPIVGFVIDVSRSMKHGMRDQFTSEGTRIDSVLSALERAAHAMGARTFSPAGSRADEVLVFAYVFGFTRSRDQVCDLFSLLAALRGSQRRSISPARAVLDDPRARLRSIAVENGRAGWAKWMDSTLDEEEARNVVLNLSRYPSVEGLLRDLLPDLSVEDIEVAASVTKKGLLHRMRRVARIEGKDARTAVRLAREARRAHGPKELEKRVHSAQTVLELLAARVLTERELIDAFDHHDIELGDSTLSVRDAARLLGDMHIEQRAGAGPGTSIVGLEDIFFGSTPMCAALRRARCRFKSIRADLQKDRPLDNQQRPDAREVPEGKGDFGSSTHGDSKSLIDVLADIIEAIHLVASLLKKLEDRSRDLRRCILVIVSDGLPTDGDPGPVLEDMRARGAVIISCLVTSRDLSAPRSLVAEPEEGWDASALLMFKSASPTLEAPSQARFLTDNGWSVPPGARLFTQINHSAVLSEFLESALG